MFKRPLILTSFLLAIAIGGFAYRYHVVTNEDRLAYDELMGKELSNAPEIHKVKQARKQVSKDIFIVDGNQRKQIHLEGDLAELLMEKDGETTTLVENIHPFTCVYQEEIDPQNEEQSIIWLEADHAKFNYRTKLLEANDLHIYNYKIPGFRLPDQRPNTLPIIVGVAEHANLIMDGKEPHLNVTGFKGKDFRNITLSADTGFYDQEKCHFDDNVILTLKQDVVLKCEHAEYNLEKPIIKVTPSEGNRCQITNSQGDYINADQMDLNRVESTVFMLHPQGSLQIQRTSATSTPLTFKSDTLLWQNDKEQLTLNKKVTVSDLEFGTIETDDVLTLTRKSQSDGRKTLQNIQSKGNTLLTYTDDGKKTKHTLTCHGNLSLDNEKGTIMLTTNPGNPQMVFEDFMGTIYADQAFITYIKQEDRQIPQKLYIEGHLKIINHTSDLDPQNRYALADHAEYDFITRELNLTAAPNQRVLFFDKNSHLEVSAPGLKIKRDVATGEDSIKGQGDVRFIWLNMN